jgi:LPPG:FO 2-phospho-L-lactate transferase
VPRILAIAGGVGGAKLAVGLAHVLAPGSLTIAVNTGDDETFHGLHVSPDLDSVTYALAGLTNPETGWGVAGESFRTLEALARLGAETWFRLGDVDMATHLRRTALLREGRTLSEATAVITGALGIEHAVVPMSDDPVRTVALTNEGELAFQDYFVRRGCEPAITGVRFDGADAARPSPGLAAALREADAVVYCPSNPLVSIGPVLAVPGVRDALARFGGPRIAVSPLVGGQAVKGPAAKMLAELGEEPGSGAVARRYAGIADALVLDEADAADAPVVQMLGLRPVVTPTLMRDGSDKVRLAHRILALVEGWFD